MKSKTQQFFMPNVKWKFVVVLPFYGIGRVTIMHVCVHMCMHIINMCVGRS